MSTEKVTVFAKFTAKKGEETNLKNILIEMAKTSSQDKGCIEYEVICDKNNDAVFMFRELWESQEDADNHVQMDYLPPFRERRAPMLACDPEISTWVCAYGK